MADAARDVLEDYLKCLNYFEQTTGMSFETIIPPYCDSQGFWRAEVRNQGSGERLGMIASPVRDWGYDDETLRKIRAGKLDR
jgi:hypothetical protein